MDVSDGEDSFNSSGDNLLDDFAASKVVSTKSPSFLTSKIVLTFCCVAYVFSSIGTDAIRVLQLDFEKIFSHTQMGVVYAGYYFTATLLVLLVGPAIDRFGVGICTLVCAVMGAAGFVLQVLGSVSNSFVLVVLGRSLHGGGAEALFICWDTLLSVWFFGGSSTLAMSLYCAAGRFGDLLVTGVLPNLGDRQTKMMVSLGCVVLSLCSNIALTLVDRKQRHLLPQAANVGPNVQTSFWSQIRSFPRGYWLCVGVSVILYGLVGQQLQFVPTIIGHWFDNPIVPSMLPCITIVMALVLTPIFGCILTQQTKYLAVLLASVCLLFSCLSLFFSASIVVVVIGLALLGLCYALTSSGIWGTIACYGNSSNFGLLYSIPYAFFNLYNFATSIMSGTMIDYLPVIYCLIVWSVMAFLGLVLGLIWFKTKND